MYSLNKEDQISCSMQVLQCTYSFCYIYAHKNIGMYLILYTLYREETGSQRGGLLKKSYFQTRSLLDTGLTDGLLFLEGRVGQLLQKKKFLHNLTPRNYFQLRKKLPTLPSAYDSDVSENQPQTILLSCGYQCSQEKLIMIKKVDVFHNS